LIGSETGGHEDDFSTADVRPRDRFDSWHAAARKYIIDHDSRPDCRLTFAAKLCYAALDEMTLASVECSPMMAVHTSRQVSQTTPDELFVCRELTGTMLFEQSRREAALKAGRRFRAAYGLLPREYRKIHGPGSMQP
jgi:hypothetical protein